jgi:asparagine synthetase B (glutamine-hydrolysing)
MPASVLTKHQFFSGSVWFASEMKALSDDCERFMSFLPGHIYSSKQGFHLFML